MVRVVQTSASLLDIDGIWDYIGEDSEAHAIAFVRKIERTLSRIAENPHMGRARDELKAGVRSFPVGYYVIFYMAIEDGVEILRVLHGARDIRMTLDI